MKFPSFFNPMFSLILVLAITQFACGFVGGSTPAVNPPPIDQPAGETQPTQPPVTLSEHGTQAEAQTMLQKALEHYNTVGREQALADFSGRASPFFDRDLYVVCVDVNNTVTANGGFPELVGGPVGIMDENGNPLGTTILETASTTAVNSVNYQWTNPATGQTQPKTLFFQKVGTDVCGVGVYNP